MNQEYSITIVVEDEVPFTINQDEYLAFLAENLDLVNEPAY